MAVIRVLWWNVDGRQPGRTNEKITALLALKKRSDVIALSEVDEATGALWRSGLGAKGVRVHR